MTKTRPQRIVPANGARRPYLATCIAILVVAAAVRIYGAMNDLWLDEILATELPRHVSSPLDIVVTRHLVEGNPLRTEVNHYLYTFYLYLIGPQGNSLIYRLPSLLSGVGAVAMAGLIGRRRDLPSALLAMLLVGCSYTWQQTLGRPRSCSTRLCFSITGHGEQSRYAEA